MSGTYLRVPQPEKEKPVILLCIYTSIGLGCIPISKAHQKMAVDLQLVQWIGSVCKR